MIRFCDIIFSSLGLFLGLPILLIIFIISLFDIGSPLFIQKRVGLFQKPFKLIKFRTMPKDTEYLATHLVKNVNTTKFSRFLRRTKFDELPQLWNVLLGEMSLIGPRPNLLNQKKLIKKRNDLGVYKVRPGITGLAQINRVNMSEPNKLAKIDHEMIKKMSLYNYFKYIFYTLCGKGSNDQLEH